MANSEVVKFIRGRLRVCLQLTNEAAHLLADFRDEPIELREVRTSRRFVRVHSDAPRRVYVEQRPVRRHYVEQPSETRRRRYD